MMAAKVIGARAIRPCGNDPEQLSGADHDEGAPGIDQRRKPIGYAEAAAAAPRSTGWAGSATSKASPLSACEMPASASAVWSASSRSDGAAAGMATSLPHRCVTGLELGASDRRSSASARPARAAREVPPAPVPAPRPPLAGRSAPAIAPAQRAAVRQPARAATNPSRRLLQHRGVVAQLRGFAERLVDDRVERDDPADELAPDRLGVLEFGSGSDQCAGEPAGDLGRNGGEQRGKPAPGAAEIRYGEDDAGADDADADLAGAVDGEHEGLPVRGRRRRRAGRSR